MHTHYAHVDDTLKVILRGFAPLRRPTTSKSPRSGQMVPPARFARNESKRVTRLFWMLASWCRPARAAGCVFSQAWHGIFLRRTLWHQNPSSGKLTSIIPKSPFFTQTTQRCFATSKEPTKSRTNANSSEYSH